MDVEDFVAGALQQVKDSIARASDEKYRFSLNNDGVHFDLAVTNTHSSETGKGGKGKLAIKVIEAELGKDSKSIIGHEAVSRIGFSVHLYVRPDQRETGITVPHRPPV